jgi:hypothetical protein
VSIKGYLIFVPFENVASMEYGNNGAPDKATVATTPGHLAGPFEVREVIGPATPEFSPDWEGDRSQAVEVAAAELGLMIAQWHRRKRPEVTMTELAHILSGQVRSALKYALRAEQAGNNGGAGEDDDG